MTTQPPEHHINTLALDTAKKIIEAVHASTFPRSRGPLLAAIQCLIVDAIECASTPVGTRDPAQRNIESLAREAGFKLSQGSYWTNVSGTGSNLQRFAELITSLPSSGEQT